MSETKILYKLLTYEIIKVEPLVAKGNILYRVYGLVKLKNIV